MSEAPSVLTREAGRSELLKPVADDIRAGERFLLTTHENPDGDALGSLLAMHHVLRQAGKDSVMFLAAKEFPLPVEYRFLPLEEVFHEPPADLADRVVVFLDCGNIDRMPADWLQRAADVSLREIRGLLGNDDNVCERVECRDVLGRVVPRLI